MNYSPDRTTIIFTNLDSRGISQIFMADNDALCNLITDCNTRQITDGDANWSRPRFSPDGTLILATSDQNENLDLFLLTLDGNVVEQLTDSPEDESEGVWKPE
jgi:Tol biopolymer transport system component